MLHKKVLPFVIVMAVCTNLTAQTKQVNNIEQVWVGYFNQIKLNNKWGIWVDAHVRTKENFTNNLSLAMLRVGGTYYLSNDAKFTIGTAYINHFPSDNHKNISQPEHRPWQQFQWHTKYNKLKLMQWIRVEERFRRNIKNDNELADGYNFNGRIRYNFLAQYPLSKKAFQKGSFSAAVSNEVFVNFGKNIVYNTFDQNRFFIGLHYHTSTHNFLQFGYMNVFTQTAAGNVFRNNNTIRLFYFQNINLIHH